MKKPLTVKFGNIILFTAVLMMIASALISYFIVKQNEPKITLLKIEIQSKQALIRDIWTNIGQTDAKANSAVLISVLVDHKNEAVLKLLDYYLSGFPNLKENTNVFEILKALDQDKKNNIDIINNLYIEQENLQNKITELESLNKFYSDIAFFLQILSLVIIILKKDTSLI